MAIKTDKNFFKKLTAVIAANCFLFSFVAGPSVSAVIDGAQAGKDFKQIFSDFVLPYSYGKITDSHFAGSDRVIINIQDLHCHPDVQKNIGKIIELFDKKYGVQNVFLEGAYGDVDTSWINAGQTGARNAQIIEKMIQTGALTGAEYYSALKSRPDMIKGLESKDAYLENLKTFGWMIEERRRIELILNGIEESVSGLKKKYYNKRQFRLERLYNDYTANKISSRKYFTLLAKHTDRLGIDLYKYPNTLYYLEILNEEKELNYDAISSQLRALLSTFKELLPQQAYSMLLESTGNLSEIDKLYGYLISIAKKFEMDLEVRFPQLNRYFRHIELGRKINPLELVSEEKRLTDEINARFSDTKAQREIVFLISFGRYLKDLLGGKITSSDYEYYKNNIERYKTLYVKYVDNKVLSLLDEYIERVGEFYKINVDRNDYFSDSIFNSISASQIENPVISGDSASDIIVNMEPVNRVDVIITGGFHTEGVSRIFKDKGVSYITITPNVDGGVKEAEETYYRIAKEQSKISYQALANMVASLSIVDQIKLWFSVDSASAKKIYNEYITVNDDTVKINGTNIVIKLDPTGKPSSQEESNDTFEHELIVKAAEILDSDEGKAAILPALVEKIRENLSQKYAGQITQESLGKINLDEVRAALDGDIAKLENIIKNSLDRDNFVLDNLKLFSQLLEKAAKRVGESSAPVLKNNKRNVRKSIITLIIAFILFLSPLLFTSCITSNINLSPKIELVSAPRSQPPLLTNSASSISSAVEKSPILKDFASKPNINRSIEMSNDKKIQDAVSKAYDRLEAEGIKFIRRFPVLFLKGYAGELAMAFSKDGFIVVSADSFEKLSEKEQEEFLIIKIAHEGTHIHNYETTDKIDEGMTMTTIEDEYLAYQNTTEAVRITRPSDEEAINAQAMVEHAFEVILDNSKIIEDMIREFENNDTKFKDLNYFDIKILQLLQPGLVSIELYNETKSGGFSYFVKVNTVTGRIEGADVVDRDTEKIVKTIELRDLNTDNKKPSEVLEEQAAQLNPVAEESDETEKANEAKLARQAKRAAIMEIHWILLATFVSKFFEKFLNRHQSGDAIERRRGLGLITVAVRKAWEASYSSVFLLNFIEKIFNTIKVSYIAHRDWNKKNPNAKLSLKDETSEGKDNFDQIKLDPVKYARINALLANPLFKKELFDSGADLDMLKLFTDKSIESIMKRSTSYLPDNTEAVMQMIIGSVRETLSAKEIIKDSYALLSGNGITFKTNAPVIFVVGDQERYDALANGDEVIVISATMLRDSDGNKIAQSDAVKRIAALLAHENVHIQDYLKKELVNLFDTEASAHRLQAQVMEKLGVDNWAAAGRVAEVFDILAQKDKSGWLKERIGSRASSDPIFSYKEADFKPNLAGETIIAIYDINLEKDGIDREWWFKYSQDGTITLSEFDLDAGTTILLAQEKAGASSKTLSDFADVLKIPQDLALDMSFLDEHIERSRADFGLQKMFADVRKSLLNKKPNWKSVYLEPVEPVVIDSLPANKKFVSLTKGNALTEYADQVEFPLAQKIINGQHFIYKGKKYVFIQAEEFNKLGQSYLETLMDYDEPFETVEIISNPSPPQFVEIVAQAYSNLTKSKSTAMLVSMFSNLNYQEQLSIAEKLIADNLSLFPADSLQSLFKNGDEQYLKIIAQRNSKDYLVSLISDKNIGLKYRVFAYMYLKAAGLEFDSKNIKDEMLNNISSLIENNIAGDFDLRAALTAVWELLVSRSPELAKDFKHIDLNNKKMYAQIETASKLTAETNQNATSSLMFDLTDLYVLLHESGHNLLDELFPNLDQKDLRIVTLHEIFAYSISEAHDISGNHRSKSFAEKYDNYTAEAKSAGLSLKSNGIYGEPHMDAKMFLSKVNEAHDAFANRTIDWNLMGLSVIEYIRKMQSGEIKEDDNLNALWEIYNNKFKQKNLTGQYAARQALEFANPAREVKLSQQIAVNAVADNSQLKEFESENIGIQDSLVLLNDSDLSLAQTLQNQGFNTALVSVLDSKPKASQWRKIKVSITDGDSKTNVYQRYDEYGLMRIGFYSASQAQAVDANIQAQALKELVAEGVLDDAFKGIKQIVVTNELTASGVIDIMKNDHTNSVNSPSKEIVLNLYDSEKLSNFESMCKNESQANGIGIFVVSQDQAKMYAESINRLRKEGIRFIVEVNASNYSDVSYDGSRIDAQSIKDLLKAQELLQKFQTLKNESFAMGQDIRITVKFDDNILDAFAAGKIDIWKKYSIIPIAGENSSYRRSGKSEIEFPKNASQENIKRFLSDDNAAALSVSDTALLGNIKEEVKTAKTAKQSYNKGYNASLDSRFDYTSSNPAALFDFITKNADDSIDNLKSALESVLNSALSVDSRSYLEFLMKKEKYAEALGFMRGVAMNSARKEILETFAQNGINFDIDKFKSENSGKYQKAVLTLAVKLQMSGS
ncbi:MAG: hypothetical protein LBQ47_08110, partial [Endomicrobium sp.]|nr:hypothetical protein [Endomicrobium sp.]